MKTFVKPSIYITIMALLFAACKKDLPIVILDTDSATEAQLTATETSIELLEARQNNVAVIFNWTRPSYNVNGAFVHTLQFAKAGTNFAAPVNEAIGAELKKEYTEKAFNVLVLALGIKPGDAEAIQVRVRSVMNDSVAPLYSNAHTITVTPYSLEQFLYVPGDYQGWAPASAAIVRSGAKNNKYEGFVNFAGGSLEFKMTDAPNWDNGIFGDADASGTSGTVASPGNNFKVAGVGYWRLKVDLTNNTWSSTKTDWGIVGSARTGDGTGWDNDDNMTYDAASKTLTITKDLFAGMIKFRANDGWDINFGDTGGDGSLEYGGADIPISSAGNYTITLDLSGGESKYTYIVKKN